MFYRPAGLNSTSMCLSCEKDRTMSCNLPSLVFSIFPCGQRGVILEVPGGLDLNRSPIAALSRLCRAILLPSGLDVRRMGL
jgi:hypothetical protein